MDKNTKISRKIDDRLEAKVPPVEGKDVDTENDEAGEEPAEEDKNE